MNRHRHINTPRAAARLLLAAALLLATLTGRAQNAERKTVVIAVDWDFAPFEYANNTGQTTGFNVEVLQTILNSLGIPHQFEIKSRKQCIRAFEEGKADLIVDYKNRFNGDDVVRSRSILYYYKISIATRTETPVVTNPNKLKDCGTVVLNANNDSVVYFILNSMAVEVHTQFMSPREAMAGVATGKFDYFLWGEEPLKWKMKEYNLTNINISEMELQPCEMHIVGHDKTLIDDIDNLFARMKQKGEIDNLRDKWFHPERIKAKTSHVVLYIVAAVLLLTFISLIIYFLAKRRARNAIRRNEDMEAMMHKALIMGNFSAFVYNLRQGRVSNEHGHVLPDDGVTKEAFMEKIHPDDRQKVVQRQNAGKRSELLTKPFTIRWNSGTDAQAQWIDITGYSFLETNVHGRPENVIITSKDITEDIKKEQQSRDMAYRYRKMFDSAMVAMSFYNKDGYLVDMNERMRELLDITTTTEEFFYKTNLFDFDLVKDDMPQNSMDTFHACQRMNYPELAIDKYVEFRVRPSFGKGSDLMYYIITARDVTNERKIYLELNRQNKALREATETNTRYEREMRDLLENCGMYIWNADVKAGIIYFSRSLYDKEFSESFDEYVNGMFEDHRQLAAKNISNIENYKKPFSMVRRFYHTPVTNEPAWFAVSGMPLLDEQGNLTSLFGVVRDVTDLMEAQERLKEETERAEHSAMLKSTFLANMTHEIRTPLNAIVGFSDLLQMIDDPEQRQEFIRIIRNNCDMLLRLINDIFEASTMDIKPLEIKPAPVDFANEFNVVCQSLSQRVQTPQVEFIVQNPYQSFQTLLDMGRMQQVITNFVTNAVKYTTQGHIRVGYRYERKGIYMYCEDTGTGIPKNKQAKVFERFVKLNDFVQGTGLGLSICKSIAERANGSIGVESEGEGHGSTFWVWVPCPQYSCVATPSELRFVNGQQQAASGTSNEQSDQNA